MLFDGFAAASEVTRQEARVGAAARRIRETSEFTALDAAESYLESFRQRELVGLAEENIAAHLNTLELVTIKAEGGAASLTDVEQTQARVSTAEDALIETRSRVRDADANYINTIGEPPLDLVRPIVPFQALPENEAAAVAMALKLNPTIAVTRADLETAKADYQSTRAGFWPRVDLEVGANSNRNLEGTRGQTSDITALVVMRYNLFNGGADAARRQEFIARIAEARQRMLQVQRATELEIRIAWNALATARERLTALRRQVQANDSVLGAYQLQFDIGRRDLLDLLDAENDLYRSRTNLLTAEFVELFGVYRVLATAGVLLATLDLAPPSESLTILEERRLLELEETLRTMTKYTDEEEEDGDAPLLDPNAPVLDPNAPVLDPNAPVLDPNAPVLDPNAPLLDPNAPILDPEDEPASGRKLPGPADGSIAAAPAGQPSPLSGDRLSDLPKTFTETPRAKTVDDPVLWVWRPTTADSDVARSASGSSARGPRESPAVAQLAVRSPSTFVDFTGLERSRLGDEGSAPLTGLVLHKLPSDLLEFEFAEPSALAIADPSTTEHPVSSPSTATSPARLLAESDAHERAKGTVPEAGRIADAAEASWVVPQIARLNVPPSNIAAIPAGALFGMGAGESESVPSRAAAGAVPVENATPPIFARGTSDGEADGNLDRYKGDQQPMQVARLSPPQGAELGQARELWFAESPPSDKPGPDTRVGTEVPTTIANAPAKLVRAPSGEIVDAAEPRAKPAARSGRLMTAVSPEELMPDRYRSAAASSNALPPIVPYGFVDLDRQLVTNQTHILLPARSPTAADRSYSSIDRLGRQRIASFLETPIKASAVASLIPSGQPDFESSTPRYPFWSFE